MLIKMKIKIYRYNKAIDHSNGLMIIDNVFECYTLEDEFRTKKVYGETRIPEGVYKIALRTEGGFHQRYAKKYGSWHKGMLHILDVPGFEYILIHKGNNDDDTAGCLLVGEGNVGGANWVSGSAQAYGKLYPKIRNAIEAGEEVTIEFIDLNAA